MDLQGNKRFNGRSIERAMKSVDYFRSAEVEGINLDAIEAYEYELPDELIATEPAANRIESRLVIKTRGSEELHQTRFASLVNQLQRDDLLIFNNTQVIPARVEVCKPTGGRVELFVLSAPRESGGGRAWEAPVEDGKLRLHCMTRSSKPLRVGQALLRPKDSSFPYMEVCEVSPGMADVAIAWQQSPLSFLEAYGEIPLPPYIIRQRLERGEEGLSERDRSRYQTVFASVAGSVAAPTAGLHFSPDLLEELESRGVQRAELTLTVGPGTFQPVRHDHLSEHPMHIEEYFIPDGLRETIERTRTKGGRVIAVGTTSARALEAEARRPLPFEAGWKETDILLQPGSTFQIVDGLITNFHLPRSTLLAMIAGFVGYRETRHLYNYAIQKRLRFYSYGDACLLWRKGRVDIECLKVKQEDYDQTQ